MGCRVVIVAAMLVATAGFASTPDSAAPVFDTRVALQASQAAIGRSLAPDLEFTDQFGKRRTLLEFRGRPLIVSPVYTSCFGVCPTTTTWLRQVAETAQAVLGPGSFRVLTIGFDTENDTPQRMREFAAARGPFPPDWVFGAADAATIQALLTGLGFTYAPTPRGFDHMIQASIVDGDGTVFRQVYGQEFKPPQLVDPLKRLVLGQRAREDTLDAMIEGVRLFCTVYDPKSGRYRFDWSIVLSAIIGVLCFTAVAMFLWRSWRRTS
ncbi:MAG: SCO family protein [Burkholderiales bacterium]